MMAISKVTNYRNQVLARGMRVSLEHIGLFQKGFTSNYYTNDNGVIYIKHESNGKATVFINGNAKGTMRTPGREVYF
ncbi:MAG: hypothetical protein WBP41_08075 [Saprospiraceae bacterium]